MPQMQMQEKSINYFFEKPTDEIINYSIWDLIAEENLVSELGCNIDAYILT